MREHKFRVFDNTKNKMYYFEGLRINHEYNLLGWHHAESNDYHDLDIDEDNISGVMDFTGLKDKNGEEIFEGDIVETQIYYNKPYSDKRKGIRHVGVVEHRIGEGDFGDKVHKQYSSEWIVKIGDFYKSGYCCGCWGDFFDCKVIGNIYENHELLKGA